MNILANRKGGVPAGLVIGLVCVSCLVFGSAMILVPSEKPEIAGQKIKNKTLHPVHIRKPDGPPTIAMKVPGSHVVVQASCSQCHTTRQPNFSNRSTEQLDEFHKGFAFTHGNLSCLSCHNSDDYDSLKLASGKKVAFKNVMNLCAQCHSQQMKDYQHGAHGGMNGYWDRTRGPQQKNNCIDCHNPHGPKFPKMKPTFKPKDRFLDTSH